MHLAAMRCKTGSVLAFHPTAGQTRRCEHHRLSPDDITSCFRSESNSCRLVVNHKPGKGYIGCPVSMASPSGRDAVLVVTAVAMLAVGRCALVLPALMSGRTSLVVHPCGHPQPN